jgi:xylulokinase
VAAQAAGGPDAFAALAAEAMADPSTTPIVLPYLSGERTPINDPAARGVIAGLSLLTTRGDVYRGLIRGIAQAVRANVEAMRALGAPIHRTVAVGGGTADRLLLQEISDATGLAQELPTSTVGASRGDAFLAGRAAGVLRADDLATWVEVRDRIEPGGGATERAAEAVAFRRLYDDSRDLVHDLAAQD